MKTYRIVFSGTTEMSLSILKVLQTKKEINLVAVLSQPDRKKDRHGNFIFSPIKKYCLENNLNLFQPIKNIDVCDDLKLLNPDFLITCAYGQFISQKILDIFIDCVNVHGSILPAYRGGRPIQKAIEDGLNETGISLIRMIKAMDAGPIFCQDFVKIESDDDAGSLFVKMGNLGSKMVQKYIIDIFDKKIIPYEQDKEKVSFAYNLTNDQEKIDFNKNAFDVNNFVRALSPSPNAFTFLDNQRIKILKTDIINDFLTKTPTKPGQIICIDKKGIIVACKDNTFIHILKLQREGKTPQLASIYYKNPSIFKNNAIFV